MNFVAGYLRKIAPQQSTSIVSTSVNWRLEYIRSLFLISVLSLLLAALVVFVYLGTGSPNIPDNPGTRRVETSGRAYVMIDDNTNFS